MNNRIPTRTIAHNHYHPKGILLRGTITFWSKGASFQMIKPFYRKFGFRSLPFPMPRVFGLIEEFPEKRKKECIDVREHLTKLMINFFKNHTQILRDEEGQREKEADAWARFEREQLKLWESFSKQHLQSLQVIIPAGQKKLIALQKELRTYKRGLRLDARKHNISYADWYAKNASTYQRQIVRLKQEQQSLREDMDKTISKALSPYFDMATYDERQKRIKRVYEMIMVCSRTSTLVGCR